ncbi:DUF1178 family protein [Luteithermobacter gelatinilyticus]|uniref:DUF1178 family protein n=1 Tax=Luteithermobacter gelatinilyticus TaxID=2582913 RepID=UPI00110585FA|nr:DUF1178 family protein [Luteithermobacter gelatinilyticus]|tara:strand:+ start:5514 stop:6032 length:519 start_codon:yes stop_codon:yes gene_type:complete
MIVFDLKCAENHVFEAWFKNSEAYEAQAAARQIVCPHCGNTQIGKSVMAPNIAVKSNRKEETRAPAGPESMLQRKSYHVAASANVPQGPEVSAEDVKRAMEHMYETMAKYRKYIQETCENVGADFAEEARKIHYGEAEERGIYGEATLEETQELLDEGIEIFPVPGGTKLDS